MIQRIQSLYLLISLLLMGALLVVPFAEIAQNGEVLVFDRAGISGASGLVQNGLPIAILIAIVVALHVFIIFSFKKRLRQVRLCIFTIFLMLGLFGMFYFFTYFSFSGAQISFKMTVVFPLIAIILDYLAMRAIGKDEALVRSIDRIR